MSEKVHRNSNDISDASNTMSSSCLLCRSALSDNKIRAKDYINNIEGIFNYIRCSECGSYIQSPIPSQKFLNTCYKSKSLDYFHIPDKEKFLIQSKSRTKEVFQKCAFTVFSSLKTVNLLPKYPAPGKVLEIGCSYGWRLMELKKMGYDVIGLENNKEMVRFAHDELHLNVVNGLGEDVIFQNGAFDIAIMSMVLEHCRKPIDLIYNIAQWLRSDGELILSVPCCDGIEFRIFQEYCYIVHPPYHLFLPSVEGIQRLLQTHFQIDEMKFQYSQADLVTSAYISNLVEPSFWKNLIAKAAGVQSIERLLRYLIFALTRFGLRTSRVSIRCTKI